MKTKHYTEKSVAHFRDISGSYLDGAAANISNENTKRYYRELAMAVRYGSELFVKAVLTGVPREIRDDHIALGLLDYFGLIKD